MSLYFNFQHDRSTELLALAASEGITLPLPVDLIVWFESHGCIVNLCTGRVTLPIMAEARWEPTPTGKAVSHLLTPAQCEAEAADYEDDIEQRDWLRYGF